MRFFLSRNLVSYLYNEMSEDSFSNAFGDHQGADSWSNFQEHFNLPRICSSPTDLCATGDLSIRRTSPLRFENHLPRSTQEENNIHPSKTASFTDCLPPCRSQNFQLRFTTQYPSILTINLSSISPRRTITFKTCAFSPFYSRLFSILVPSFQNNFQAKEFSALSSDRSGHATSASDL